MSLAQDPAQTRGSSGIDYGRFSHASAMAIASMASTILPRRALFSPKPMENSFYSRDREGEIGTTLQDFSPHLPVHRIGAGLANLGNTCFLNAVLQCLTYTPPLAARLQSGFHQSSCRITGFCAMCALESHVKEALASHGRSISPKYLVKNLRCISRSFQMWQQEDAHEYMRYLIEALQKCCVVEASGGKSLIQNVFGGQLRSQVKCTQCSHCSNKYDPFLDLSLEVEEADSLQTALAHFTAIEELDGDNKYQCSRCRVKVRALKQFTIDKAPPVLTIQLKRFSSLGGYGGKIDKKVHFDKNLDLNPFVNGGEDGNVSYTLYAVLVHSGWSIHSGHYYCFVRTAMDTWYLLDDNQVSKVSERTVLEQKAYILLYMRDDEVIKLPNADKFPRTTTNIFLPVGHVHQEEEAVSKRASVRNRTMHSEVKFQVSEVSESARSYEDFEQSALGVHGIAYKKEDLEESTQSISDVISHSEVSGASELNGRNIIHTEDVFRKTSCEIDLSSDAELVSKRSSIKASITRVKDKLGSDLAFEVGLSKQAENPESAERLSIELTHEGCDTARDCEWATCARCKEEHTFVGMNDEEEARNNKSIDNEEGARNKCIDDEDARSSSGLPVLRLAGRSSKGSNIPSLDMTMQHLEVGSEKGDYDCRKLPIWDSMSRHSALTIGNPLGKSFFGMATSMFSECAELFLWSCFWSPL